MKFNGDVAGNFILTTLGVIVSVMVLSFGPLVLFIGNMPLFAWLLLALETFVVGLGIGLSIEPSRSDGEQEEAKPEQREGE